MCTAEKPFHKPTCWFLLIILTTIVAIRHSDFDPDEPLNSNDDCSETCMSMGHSGSYSLRGDAARAVSSSEQHFVSSSCAEAPRAAANVVPWIDTQDPLNGSFVGVFANPAKLNELRTPSDPLKLCAVQKEDAFCVCKLSGESQLGVLGRLAALLPHSGQIRALQLAERCPERVPTILAGTLLVSCLVMVGVMVWMLWLAWVSSQLEPMPPERHVQGLAEVKSPRQNFVSGFSWAAGFLLALAAMQTGALSVVRKSCDEEAVVWVVAACPALLALVAAVRLVNLMARKQLVHASLSLGIVLTDLPESSGMDACLVLAVLAYFLLVLYLVSTDVPTLMAALTALGGSAWTVLKAVSTARDMESSLQLAEVSSKSLATTSEKVKLAMLPWTALLASKLEDLGELLSSSPTRPATGKASWARLSLVQHGPVLRLLTGSHFGFLVLPALVALVTSSWCLCAIHMASYACAVGELTDLTLASSMHSLTFAPWQTFYEVTTDVSYQQLAMVAWVKPSATRSLSFAQPDPTEPTQASSARPDHGWRVAIEENHSAAVVEVQLAHRRIPRVAKIGVQGLRPSLPETDYQVRFSPATTLPTVMELSAENFRRRVAWSTIPGSVISVPAGVNDLQIEVGLTDFVLGIPGPPGHQEDCSSQDAKLWTAFDPLPNATEAMCSRHCASLHCFKTYPGANGCFMVLGDSACWEARGLNTSQGVEDRAGRQLQGRLGGCRLSQAEEDGKPDVGTAMQCGQPADANAGRLAFGQIRPDWAGSVATLSFSLDLQIGEQRFEADFTPIALHRGPPRPSDALSLLLGENDSGTVVLGSNASVDSLGRLVVSISEYDPVAWKSLRLLVMPMVADPAFRANWSEWTAASGADLKLFKKHGRCQESGLIRSRYKACGARGSITHGRPLEDQPLLISLDPFMGRPESPPTFAVVPRKRLGRASAGSAEHSLRFDFPGVDSPTAWAARRHGCRLLNSTFAEPAVFYSADALCELLSHCADRLCSKARDKSLGGADFWDPAAQKRKHYSPLLPAEGIVKLLTGLPVQAPSCNFSQKLWHYATGSMERDGFGFQIPIRTLLQQADQLGEDGLSFLRELRKHMHLDGALDFDKQVAQDVWELSKPSSGLLAMLAAFNETLPQLLLQAMMQSPSADVPPVTPKLQAVFANITSLRVELLDLAPLRHLPVLAQLAPKLRNLSLSCRLCDRGRQVSDEDLRALSRHKELVQLQLTGFQCQSLPPEIFQGLGKLQLLFLSNNKLKSLPPEIFQGLGELQVLALYSNQLQSLPPEIFKGLGELQQLGLQDNQLQSLPPEIFKGLGKLQLLFLSNNQLQSLPSEIFKGAGKLQKLYLYGNQLQSQPAVCSQGVECS